MILIVCALKSEVEFIKNKCEIKEEFGYSPFHFYNCSYNNSLNFFLAKCGLGKVRSASFTQYAIDKFNGLELIVNFGSAGAIAKDVSIGDFFLCIKTIEHDFETLRKFKPEFNLKEEIDENILEKFNIKKGILVSGTQNIDSKKKKSYFSNEYNATIGDWEGSSIMQVAHINNKKCFIFKTVTDFGNENLLEDFKKYSKNALDKNSLNLLNFLSFYNNNY